MKKLLSAFLITLFAYNFSAQTKKDSEFTKKVSADGLFEVKLGQLVQNNAFSPEVKKLGKKIVEDHIKANDELKTLAAKKNLEISSSLTKKDQKKYDKIAKKQGNDFDKTYSKCMVMAHKKAIAAFKAESEKGDDQELKIWATNTLPVLQSHENMAKEICKNLKNKK